MRRDQALRVVLVLAGLLFLALIYPMADSLLHADSASYADDMMLSLYFVLGIFLLMAAREPSAHRSLIAFTAWSSFAHAAVMCVMAAQKPEERSLLWGVGILAAIGVLLLVLAPPKQPMSKSQPATT